MPVLILLLLLFALAAAACLHLHARSDAARMRRRLKAFSNQTKSEGAAGGAGEGAARRRLIQAKLRDLEKQRQRTRRSSIAQLLLQSGMEIDMRTFVVGSAALGLAVTVLSHLFGLPLATSPVPGVAAGLLLPRMALRFVIRRRQARFTHHFADALDILVRGVRSGLPVGESLRMVARESPDPVGPEFQLLNDGQRVGLTLKQSLDRATERMPVTELTFFAIVLQIQQTSGGNLAGTLDNLSTVLRSRKRLRDKTSAMSSEAKSSAAIIGALPIIVCAGMSLVNPDYLAPLFTEGLGTFLLGGGIAWMLLGVLVMAKMINFDY